MPEKNDPPTRLFARRATGSGAPADTFGNSTANRSVQKNKPPTQLV
jgi:hypothetical protein